MGFTRRRNPDEMKKKTYKKRKLGTKDMEMIWSGFVQAPVYNRSPSSMHERVWSFVLLCVIRTYL